MSVHCLSLLSVIGKDDSKPFDSNDGLHDVHIQPFWMCVNQCAGPAHLWPFSCTSFILLTWIGSQLTSASVACLLGLSSLLWIVPSSSGVVNIPPRTCACYFFTGIQQLANYVGSKEWICCKHHESAATSAESKVNLLQWICCNICWISATSAESAPICIDWALGKAGWLAGGSRAHQASWLRKQQPYGLPLVSAWASVTAGVAAGVVAEGGVANQSLLPK